ncbi:hypothetical protein CV093_15315 [Oceanobacillus sp. 143]|uniref:DUF1640 domain-containing protein n=1 Tax=Oceanobacillus zhaokaii TaxID=2052660 RepID=A0A345PJ72_9BACI|nr:hypothetical protein [Oceanobacillus zhaokaii]AXI10052.1 hypothetical protein CUC15_14435 [Oceanobacillus zhaokaii]QGS69196.1 hypothetical protein CV093_15315 [Oceanobacillus sp. 143]
METTNQILLAIRELGDSLNQTNKAVENLSVQMQEMKVELRQEMQEMKNELRQEMQEIKVELKEDIKKIDTKITILSN